MQLPLNAFEKEIDRTIVKRGYDYFTSDQVQDIATSGKGDYEATVSGSEEYEVIIRIESGNVEQYDCDCPFDNGPVCKHVVAVLYAIRDMESAEELSIGGSPKKPGDKNGISELIDACPEGELRAFLKTYSRKHDSFVSEFLMAFPGTEISDDVYRKQLKAILREVSDRDGYIDWKAANRLNKDLNKLLGIAGQYQAKGQEEAVMAIGSAVMEELIVVLHYADDSNGIIRDAIYTAFDLLSELAQSDSESIRNNLRDFFLRHSEQKTFEGLGLAFTRR